MRSKKKKTGKRGKNKAACGALQSSPRWRAFGEGGAKKGKREGGNSARAGKWLSQQIADETGSWVGGRGGGGRGSAREETHAHNERVRSQGQSQWGVARKRSSIGFRKAATGGSVREERRASGQPSKTRMGVVAKRSKRSKGGQGK